MGGKDKDNNFSSLSPFLNKNIKKIVSYGEARNKISIALRDAVELNEVFSLRDAVEECRKSAVSGDIVLGLYKGNITILSRRTKNKAYSMKKVSFEENKTFNKKKVENFINYHSKQLNKS